MLKAENPTDVTKPSGAARGFSPMFTMTDEPVPYVTLPEP